jgi:hypothetical protein
VKGLCRYIVLWTIITSPLSIATLKCQLFTMTSLLVVYARPVLSPFSIFTLKSITSVTECRLKTLCNHLPNSYVTESESQPTVIIQNRAIQSEASFFLLQRKVHNRCTFSWLQQDATLSFLYSYLHCRRLDLSSRFRPPHRR